MSLDNSINTPRPPSGRTRGSEVFFSTWNYMTPNSNERLDYCIVSVPDWVMNIECNTLESHPEAVVEEIGIISANQLQY